MTALDKAIAMIGSQAALARELGVERSAVNQWKLPGRKVPLAHCPTIERLTKGQVRCEQLRADFEWSVVRKGKKV